MRLTDTERKKLSAALTSAFGTLRYFDELVIALNKNPDDFAPRDGVSVRIKALIEAYEARGDILVLMEMPMQVQGWEQNMALKAVLDQVRQTYQERQGSSWMVIPRPFDAFMLDQGRPFIDRLPFRQYCEELIPEKGRRFLVVNGQPGSGKTHSHYLIEAAAPHYGYRFCFIELEQEIPSKYYPDIMARRIDRDLALPDTEPLIEQHNVPDRWAQELCDWLVEKIKIIQDEGKFCWIVLDGFSDSDLPDETKQLVKHLIDAVDKRLTQTRLILLDFKLDLLPRTLRPFVRNEDIRAVDQPELEAFFRQLFQHVGVPFEDHHLTDAASKILQDLPAASEERMLEIMTRVMETTEQLLAKE